MVGGYRIAFIRDELFKTLNQGWIKLSDKKWLLLQLFFAVTSLILIFTDIFLFGERQEDGTYVAGERNFWSYFNVSYVGFSIFFIMLAEVRKRMGKRVTARTVLWALLWILGLVLLTSLTDLFW